MQYKSMKKRGDNMIEAPESRFYRDVYVSAIRKGCSVEGAKEMAEQALVHYMDQFQSTYMETA